MPKDGNQGTAQCPSNLTRNRPTFSNILRALNQHWQITGSKIEKLDLSSKLSPMASATSAV
jgi:hypothetical protein